MVKKWEKSMIATVISIRYAPRCWRSKIDIDGNIIGSVSGGCVENSVIAEGIESFRKKHRIKITG